MKKALVTGCTGQDGSYMAELLLEKGYEVHGLVRRSSSFNTGRIDHIRSKIELHYGDMTDPFSLIHILKKVRPDEVYNFAAQSHVQISWETPWYTAQTTGIGVLNLLESIRALDLECRVYQASTSELFSGKDEGMMDENTPFDPASPYGSAKLYGYSIAKNYREAFGMFICNGILFNHESKRRGDNFVTKKIMNSVEDGSVKLGNVEAMRDWGYAPEYVEAAWRMLQQEKPDDFVIATGETHSIWEFVGWVERYFGKKIAVLHDKAYDRPNDVPRLCGNPAKAKQILGWEASTKGEDIVKKMYEEK